MFPPGWMNWLKYPSIPRTASPPAAAAATPGPPAIDACDTRLVIRIASKAESGEISPVPISVRATSLPMTEAFRTVLTTCYDYLGRLIKVVNPDGTIRTISYDDVSLIQSNYDE